MQNNSYAILSKMEPSYMDGGMIVFTMIFLRIIFLALILAIILLPRLLRFGANTIGWWEENLLKSSGNWLPRARAWRARKRQMLPASIRISRLMLIIFGVIAVWFLVYATAALLFPSSLLYETLLSFITAPYAEYVFLSLVAVLLCCFFAWGIISFVQWSSLNVAPIILYNTTEKPLKVYIAGRLLGDLKPLGKLRNNLVTGSFEQYKIEVRDNSDNVVYAKEFSLDDLDTTDWKVTIGNT